MDGIQSVNGKSINLKKTKVMITKNSAEEVFEKLLKTGEFCQAIDDRNGNYVHICAHIFNAGWYATIKSCHYDEQIEKEAASKGDLFLDKDDALQMLTDFELDIEYETEEEG